MKFLVCRTSEWTPEKAPVKGAVHERFLRIDVRAPCKRPNEIPAYRGKPEDWWYAEGTNHRKILGPRGGVQGIARDFPDGSDGWFIEINSLDDLIMFTDKHGHIILGVSYDNPEVRQIEIYDGYRE